MNLARFSIRVFFSIVFLCLLQIRQMEHATALRETLSDDGDMELRFQGGHSIPVHSQKLKLASTVLKDMITAVLDDQIREAAKRTKTAEGGSAAGQDMPYVQVSYR